MNDDWQGKVWRRIDRRRLRRWAVVTLGAAAAMAAIMIAFDANGVLVVVTALLAGDIARSIVMRRDLRRITASMRRDLRRIAASTSKDP